MLTGSGIQAEVRAHELDLGAALHKLPVLRRCSVAVVTSAQSSIQSTSRRSGPGEHSHLYRGAVGKHGGADIEALRVVAVRVDVRGCGRRSRSADTAQRPDLVRIACDA